MVVSFVATEGGTQAAPSTQFDPAYISAGKEGMMVYDNTNNALKICNGTSWQTLAVGGGGVTAAGTVTGAVQFRGATAVLAADDVNFVWDDTNNRLGIGTATPAFALHVLTSGTQPARFQSTGSSTVEVFSGGDNPASLSLSKTGGTTQVWKLSANSGTQTFSIIDNNAGAVPFVIEPAATNNSIYVKSGGGVGIGTASLNVSAALDVSSTTKGLLPPRMTTAQATGITSPADGLLVYDTDTDTIKLRANGAWVDLMAGAGSEADPQVGTLTATKWCAANAGGTAIDCTADAPATGAAGSTSEVQFRNSGTGAFAADSQLVWDNTNKRLAINTAVPLSPFHMSAEGSAVTQITMDAYVDSVSGNLLIGRKARGTIAAPTATLANDTLLALGGRGYGATAFSGGSRAGMTMAASEAWTDTAQGTHIMFETTPLGSVTRAERLRIAPDGNVGIATTNPTARLQINAQTGTILDVNSGNNAGVTTAIYSKGAVKLDSGLVGMTPLSVFGRASQTAPLLQVGAETTSQGGYMTVLANGNVGIGTTNPSFKLDVVNNNYNAIRATGNSTNSVGIYVNNSVALGRQYALLSSGGGPTPVGSFNIWDDSGGGARLVIAPTGNVGIGTTTPQSQLDVFGGARLGADAVCYASKAGMLAWNANTLQVCTDAGTFTSIASSAGTGQWQNGAGSAIYYSGGNVGVGTSSPTAKFDLQTISSATSGGTAGLNVSKFFSPASTSTAIDQAATIAISSAGSSDLSTARTYSLSSTATHSGTGTLGISYGFMSSVVNNATGTVNNGVAVRANINNHSTGSINTAVAFLANAPVNSGGGTISNYYALQIADPGSTANNAYGIYQLGSTVKNYFAGSLGVGAVTPDPSAVLDITSTTRGFLPPRMTTAQRDAITSPATGLTVYNSTTNALNLYNGSAWSGVGAGSIATDGDVTLTSVADNDMLRYDAASSKWKNIGLNTALGATTMVPNWPDAIMCKQGASKVVLYYGLDNGSGTVTYWYTDNTGYGFYFRYNSATGAYSSQYGFSTYDCVTNAWSISQLYANGRAFNFIGSAASTFALNNLLAASATNTIDSTNFAQAWNWSTATTQSPMTLTANALTTGSLLSLTSSSTSINSTNGLLYVANTGAGTTGTVARFASNSAAASGLTVLANGNVGVGTLTPQSLLDVAGGARVGGDALCTAAKAGMLAWNTNTLQVCTNAGTFTSIATSSGLIGASSALSAITGATASNSILNGANPQTWSWALTGATSDAFTFTESAASTSGTAGDQSILKVATLTTSTATPLIVTNFGNGPSFAVNDETGDTDATPFLIDASGNVGIGVTNPLQLLHLKGASNPGISIENSAATKRFTMYARGDGGLGIFDDSGSTERVTIATGGNVGIGTTTPKHRLTVSGGGGYGIAQIGTDGTADSNASVDLVSLAGSTHALGEAAAKGWQILARSNAYSATAEQNDLNIYYWNGTAWRRDLAIDSLTGKVWIADICDETGANCKDVSTGWSGSGTSSGTAGFVQISGGSGTFASSSTTAGQQLFWDSTNHRLGIGLANPSGSLHVSGANPRIRFSNTASTASTLYFGADSGLAWLGTETNGPLYFITNNTEKMRIDAAGNVGIGTTSPNVKLDVAGAIVSRGVSGASTTIDWSAGNIQYTSANCGAFTFSNMQDGGTYTLVVQGAGGGTFSSSHTGLTAKTVAAISCTTAKHTVITFVRAGAYYYATYITGY